MINNNIDCKEAFQIKTLINFNFEIIKMFAVPAQKIAL